MIGKWSNVDLKAVVAPSSRAVSTPEEFVPRTLEDSVAITQLEENRAYNDRLLQVVLWSIGGSVATASLVIGVSVFSNYRATEQEKDSLRQAKKELNDLTEDTNDLKGAMARMLVRHATERLEVLTAAGQHAKAIEVVEEACSDQVFQAAGPGELLGFLKAIRGYLLALRSDLSRQASGVSDRPVKIEPDQVERLRGPVSLIVKVCRLPPKDECLQLIDDISRRQLDDDSLASDATVAASRGASFLRRLGR